MAGIPQASLFPWCQVDAASDLDRLGRVLATLPDAALMHRLEQARGRGRDEVPRAGRLELPPRGGRLPASLGGRPATRAAASTRCSGRPPCPPTQPTATSWRPCWSTGSRSATCLSTWSSRCGRAEGPGAQTPYGKVVRIAIDTDRPLFTPVARDRAAWARAYDRRTAVERVNSRLDRVLGFEQHTIRGLQKMQTRVGLALVVLLAMALGRLPAGQRDQMQSLLAPVKRAA